MPIDFSAFRTAIGRRVAPLRLLAFLALLVCVATAFATASLMRRGNFNELEPSTNSTIFLVVKPVGTNTYRVITAKILGAKVNYSLNGVASGMGTIAENPESASTAIAAALSMRLEKMEAGNL